MVSLKIQRCSNTFHGPQPNRTINEDELSSSVAATSNNDQSSQLTHSSAVFSINIFRLNFSSRSLVRHCNRFACRIPIASWTFYARTTNDYAFLKGSNGWYWLKLATRIDICIPRVSFFWFWIYCNAFLVIGNGRVATIKYVAQFRIFNVPPRRPLYAEWVVRKRQQIYGDSRTKWDSV